MDGFERLNIVPVSEDFSVSAVLCPLRPIVLVARKLPGKADDSTPGQQLRGWRMGNKSHSKVSYQPRPVLQRGKDK